MRISTLVRIRTIGLSAALVLGLAVPSGILAGPAPLDRTGFAEKETEFVTIHIDVDGEPARQVRVLAWDGNHPTVVEAGGPNGTSIHTFDVDEMRGMSWSGDSVSEGEWASGELRVPIATGFVVYEVSFRQLLGGRTEVLIGEEGSSGAQIRAIALEPASTDGRNSTRNWGIVAVLASLAARMCQEAQAEALEECLDSALILCGAGNVGKVEFTGTCGVHGSCSISCG